MITTLNAMLRDGAAWVDRTVAVARSDLAESRP
jgi:hypothetical protein